ncbi:MULTISPECIES: 1,4-dihydroxy-2-naphthoate octaprenyltransferase [unclassified Moraxella]|uniref:1,4-dihydroxy-2-naphthoate octaprenyltransferase n=1 Tax=unclassified Moraxella TaxID=2685852 RepID=UPI003AF43ED5
MSHHLLPVLLKATRPRTYPLAIAGIIVANALAYSKIGSFTAHNWQVFGLSLWVALGLQILSNLANDYGDGVKGTDDHRTDRQTAQGNLNHRTLKAIIISWAIFIFGCGVGLLYLSFDNILEILIFLAFGIIAIIAAIAYTMGKRPYGYHAKGELAVFIFFGLLNVLGGLYLQTQFIRVSDAIMSVVVGLLCTCVLMINNMRDIDTDQHSQKNTLAVHFGKDKISQYYRFILLTAYFLIATFAVLRQNFYLLSVCVMAYPVSRHLKVVRQYSDELIIPNQLAPQLKAIVIITLVTCLLIAINIVLFNRNKII